MSGTNWKILDEVAHRKSEPYRTFALTKSKNRRRWIAVPLEDTFIVQKWIHAFVLSKVPRPAHSFAYWPGSKIVDAAGLHCGCRWLIKVDIHEFFESISEIQVYRVFRKLGYSSLVSLQLAKICTREKPVRKSRGGSPILPRKRIAEPWYVKSNGRRGPYATSYGLQGSLPQGAPTSPLLAELSVSRFDEEISTLAEKYDLVYTRYADDMSFSTGDKDFGRKNVELFLKDLYSLIGRNGHRPNLSKTVVASPGSRKVVLGLLVDGLTPRLTREFRDKVRQHLYYSKELGPVIHARNRSFETVLGLKLHLQGLIRFAYSVDPTWASARQKEFDEIGWPV